MSDTPLHKVILNHRSIRSFEDKAVNPADLQTIISAAQMAPSSCFYQAYTIIRVTEPVIIDVLQKSSGGQKCFSTAKEILVFCADFYRGTTFFEEIDPAVIENTEYYTVAVIDCALAAQNALNAAESLGLGGVYVGGIRSDITAVSEALRLPRLVIPLFALCLGYPAEEPGQKPRLPMGAVCKDNYYNTENDNKYIEEYNRTNEEYYTARENAPDRWTRRCGQSLMSDTRDAAGTYIKKQGFLKRD